MRSLDGGSPPAFAVSGRGLASLSHAPLPGLVTLVAEQTREDSWRAIEVIADSHNRGVESYLQRRRHRPWRNRGS